MCKNCKKMFHSSIFDDYYCPVCIDEYYSYPTLSDNYITFSFFSSLFNDNIAYKLIRVSEASVFSPAKQEVKHSVKEVVRI